VRWLISPLLAVALLTGGRPGKPKDIIGVTSADAILGREEFSEAYEDARLEPELARRWAAMETPCTLVVVFGSWCGDSHRWIPDAIRLAEAQNPFVAFHWIGAPKSKKTKKTDWPAQSIPQKTRKVPTFWLFTPTPGGGTKLAGSVVENPPKAGQGMAEALVEMVEAVVSCQ